MAEDQSKIIRVLSYNIHKGFTSGNRDFVLSEMRRCLHEINPEFVLLQEVVGEHTTHARAVEGWPERAQFEYIAGGLWPHFVYGKNAVYDEGHHGNAILSKFPVIRWDNEDVSITSLEKRGVLHAVVKPFENLPELHIISTHLGLLGRHRQVQTERICKRIDKLTSDGHGLIVGGDFNDWALRLSRVFRNCAGMQDAHFGLHRRHARTFPARVPMLSLDRIYFRGMNLISVRSLTGAPWKRLSDHIPLLAEFELSAGEREA